MTKSLKTILIVVFTLATLILAGRFVLIKIAEEAFGTECEKSVSWVIGEYKIQEYRCLGWAGPHYYPLHLYKNGKKIASRGDKLDSCNLRFFPRRDVYLSLNICNSEITEKRAYKEPLDISGIDSVVMVNIELQQAGRLQIEDIRHFVHKWNDAPVYDYRENEKPFYPNSSYFINVHSNGDSKTFETAKFLIKGDDNWTYSFSDSRKKTSVKIFDEMWNRTLQKVTFTNTKNNL